MTGRWVGRWGCLWGGLRASLGLLALAAPAGAGPAGPLTGEWGGDGLVATFTAGGATFEASCAHGAVASPIALDAGGRFTADGRFAFDHPGPQPADEDGGGETAVFTGRVLGPALTLSIRPTGDRPAQTFHLRRGVRPKLTRCL